MKESQDQIKSEMKISNDKMESEIGEVKHAMTQILAKLNEISK
jgi:hypothetical protein